MNKFVKIALAAGVLVAPVQAHAVTGDVIFNADVSNTCAIVVNNAGTLTANVGQTVLSSENAGGAPGAATITTTSAAYVVGVTAPTAFTTSPAGSVSTFAAKYTTTGASTYTDETVNNPLATGVTNVAVDLAATKVAGSYATGLYAATVVLRCE